MKNQIIIGLGYRAKSGKDTVGNYLVRQHGFTRIAFADRLKQVAGLLCQTTEYDTSEFKEDLTPFGITGGQLLQRVGVALREAVPGIWLDASGLRVKAQLCSRIVVTDVRFEDEAQLVKELGGHLWEVRRGVAQDDHTSETSGAKIKWDRVIPNYGSLSDLRHEVDKQLSVVAPSFSRPIGAPDIS